MALGRYFLVFPVGSLLPTVNLTNVFRKYITLVTSKFITFLLLMMFHHTVFKLVIYQPRGSFK